MDLNILWIFILQIVVLVCIAGAILTYLWRNLMCRSRVDPGWKTVLLTGCDSELGLRLAKHLDALGMVVYGGVLDPGSLAAQRLETETSRRCQVLPLDVTDSEQVARAVAHVQKNLRPGETGLWAVLNCAEVRVQGELEWQSWEHCEHQIQVNFLGAARVTKACLPLLRSGKGRVVMLSQVGGRRGFPGLSVYCATKRAAEALADSIRYELAKFDVHVVNVQTEGMRDEGLMLKSHHKHMNEMWDRMSDAQRTHYHPYFAAYHEKIVKMSVSMEDGAPPLEPPIPKSFLHGMEEALLTKNPPRRILIVPRLSTRMKLFLYDFLPDEWVTPFLSRAYKKQVPGVFTL